MSTEGSPCDCEDVFVGSTTSTATLVARDEATLSVTVSGPGWAPALVLASLLQLFRVRYPLWLKGRSNSQLRGFGAHALLYDRVGRAQARCLVRTEM